MGGSRHARGRPASGSVLTLSDDCITPTATNAARESLLPGRVPRHPRRAGIDPLHLFGGGEWRHPEALAHTGTDSGNSRDPHLMTTVRRGSSVLSRNLLHSGPSPTCAQRNLLRPGDPPEPGCVG